VLPEFQEREEAFIAGATEPLEVVVAMGVTEVMEVVDGMVLTDIARRFIEMDLLPVIL
jgi:hypothetical protein